MQDEAINAAAPHGSLWTMRERWREAVGSTTPRHGAFLAAIIVAGAIAASGASAARADGVLQLVSRVEPGLLFVVSNCPRGTFTGSGFLIGPRLMLTARHVVEAKHGCSVTVRQEGSGAQARATNWSDWYTNRKSDESTTDLAVVRLDHALNGFAFRLSARAPTIGERVVALGYPYAEGLSITQGQVDGRYSRSGVPEISMRLLSDHGGSGGPIINLAGEIVGLVQRGGQQQIESLDLATFTGGDPSTLCKGAARGVASTVCGTATAGGGATSSHVYNGQSFALRYPRGWVVRNAEKNEGTYVDTTILNPSNPAWLLRIDTGFGHNSPSPAYAAAPVIKQLRGEHGYHKISLKHVTFLGYAALRWEFTIPEGGRKVRKVDIFFTDASGNDWGILFQAPATQWATAAPHLQATVAAIQLR